MQNQAMDKPDVDFQLVNWIILKNSISKLVSSVDHSNFVDTIVSLLQANINRGKGIFAQCLMRAQAESPNSTCIYAALVAIINSMFPDVGKLVVTRVIIEIKQSVNLENKQKFLNAASFTAHLVNEEVVHENLASEVLEELVKMEPDPDTFEAAISLLSLCGKKLLEKGPLKEEAIFEKLHKKLCSTIHCCPTSRVKELICQAVETHGNGYAEYPATLQKYNLAEKLNQTTHELSLESDLSLENSLDSFEFDPNFDANEEAYIDRKVELLVIIADEFLQHYGDSFDVEDLEEELEGVRV